MKFLRLDLRAFGPFTDVTLDLSGGSEGLHIIYGSNEAGKSSALRAIEQMLFGIGRSTDDDFVHSYKNLRVGGAIRRGDGTVVEFLRRKTGSLLAPDNRTPLEEGALAGCLDGIDCERFASMFGLGHDRLVSGGKEIVSGGGEVGQLLFAAGAGIADLHKIRAGLDEQAAELFKPRAQKTPINEKLKQLEEEKRRLRDAQVQTTAWVQKSEALKAATSERDAVVGQLHELERERRRLERIRQALPLVAERGELRSKRAALGQVTLLRDGFADERVATETEMRVAKAQAERAGEELTRTAADLQALNIPEPLEARLGEIDRLRERLGEHRKAQRDVPHVRAERDQHQAAAAEILCQLRPDLSLEAVETLRLTMQQRRAINELGTQAEALAERVKQAQRAIADWQARREAAQRDLTCLEPARDVRGLTAAVRRVQNQGDLDAQLSAARSELRAAEQRAQNGLARLGLWAGDLAALVALCVPAAETVERAAGELERLERQRESLEERAAEKSTERAGVERQIAELHRQGAVPSEEELQHARALRQRGWQLIQAVWRDGRPEAEAQRDFLAECGADDLVRAYEKTVERVDELADRLRRESARVVQHAQLEAHRETLAKQCEELTEQVTEARETLRRATEAWGECWRPAGITPLPPREMQSWLRRQQELVGNAEAIRGHARRVTELAERIESYRAELSILVAELGQPPAGPAECLAALVERAQHTADDVNTSALRRKELEATLDEAERQRTAAESAAERAGQELETWRGRWAAALEPLGLTPESTPATAQDVVAQLGEMFEQLKLAATAAARVEGIGGDAEGFLREVQGLAREVDPTLPSGPVEALAEQILARLQDANRAVQRKTELLRQQRRIQEELDGAGRRLEASRARLAVLCQEAGRATADELPDAERKSQAAARYNEQIDAIDQQILRLAAGATLEEFAAECGTVEADALPGRLDELVREIERLQGERDTLQQVYGERRNELRAIDTGAQAAEAAERVQDLLAQLAGHVEDYVRVRLAAVILRDGIERYQASAEAPVLRRAGELFRALTGGSFVRLAVDDGKGNEKVLKGDRGDGTDLVELSGMSEGTCDQLYLALRLASLEHYMTEHEPMPLVLDDVLIGCDDGRAAAALTILAELSRRTQVIFFTHHRHLVELARQTLSTDVLFVHELRGAALAAGSA